MDIIDSDYLEKISQLLHGVNNHAVVVCGYLENDIYNKEDLQILKPHATAIHNLLSEASHLFGALKEKHVNSLENGEKSD